MRRIKKRTRPSERGAIAGPANETSKVSDFLAAFGDAELAPGRIGDLAGKARGLVFRPAQPADPDEVLRKRLPKLLEALQILKDDMTFTDSVETQSAYLNAAEELSDSGEYRYIIFGHSHLAKQVKLKTGATYLNSGTWANLMKVPASIFTAREDALQELERFIRGIQGGAYDDWIYYRPTYIRLCLGTDDKVSKAELLDFNQSKRSRPCEGIE